MLARSEGSVDPQFMNLFATELRMQMKAHQQVSASDYKFYDRRAASGCLDFAENIFRRLRNKHKKYPERI